jgi:hypothetical protein
MELYLDAVTRILD